MIIRLIAALVLTLFAPHAYAGEPLKHTLQCYVRLADVSNSEKNARFGPRLLIAIQFSEPLLDQKRSPNFRIFDPNNIVNGRASDVFVKDSEGLAFLTKEIEGDMFNIVVFSKNRDLNENSEIAVLHHTRKNIINMHHGMCMPVDSETEVDALLNELKSLPESLTKVAVEPK